VAIIVNVQDILQAQKGFVLKESDKIIKAAVTELGLIFQDDDDDQNRYCIN
jgi:peptide methionine sulfoxide reductase MsrB